jgi:hypothetical protein
MEARNTCMSGNLMCDSEVFQILFKLHWLYIRTSFLLWKKLRIWRDKSINFARKNTHRELTFKKEEAN